MKKIAIHDNGSWSAKWIAYCREHNIPYKKINCYDSDIVDQIRDCAGLMWMFDHANPEDMLMARNVFNVAELMGLKVYPNFHTNWHFDDKLSQKYLFEALKLPTVPTWAFFNRSKALDFARTCELPIVAKLRRGAASYNVRMLKTRSQIRRYVKRMFSKGFSPAPAPLADVKTKFKVAARKGGLNGIIQRLKKAPRFFSVVMKGRKFFGNEKGYVYFQKFIPGNTCDLRISVVGNRAWGFHRIARENDFRASGSGVIDYDISKIPLEVVRQSFDAAEKLKMQSVCFDWIHDARGNYSFVEVSYGFVDIAVYNCSGFWDREMNWHEKNMYPSIATIEDFQTLCSGN
jgi:hypothetical protein